MLPWKSKFHVKVLFMLFDRKSFWEVHPLCAPPGNLSLKTPVLVELINKL